MAQLPTGGMVTSRGKADFDIFGVLLVIGTAFVLLALIYVLYKTSVMLGGVIPVPGDT
ncbi:MAG: hypothetical protein HUU22_09290 [Phycisphaerae bacterium]|nr:hypothetical protein [Phycisphaerae bacterium]NUQ46215.1 hypothetical protein [Phycisphaerae bacterium]